MDLERNIQLFGGRNRTTVLLAIKLLEESYPSELASLLGLRLFSVQAILSSFEHEGIIVSRTMGRTRRVSLNPRYFAHSELDSLLWKLAKEDSTLQSRLGVRRRRPRRPGKPGLL